MAYVEQICDGYSKKALMGNWLEERLYPSQPFREEKHKAVTLSTYSPETKIKASPASTAQDSSELCLVSKEGASGKQPTESSSTKAL